MSLYNNIEKIKYTKKTSEVVNLQEYIVFENERKEEKFIVFKFANNVNQQLLGMEFEVSQYNIDGLLVESSVVIYNSFLANANEEFVPKAKLKVNFLCKTISVKLLKAAFDRFLWDEGEYKDNSYKFEHYYRDEQSRRPAAVMAAPGQGQSAPAQKFKGKKFELANQTKKNIARFPAVFLAIVFLAVCAFIGVTLYLFRNNSDKFTLENYKLRIVDGNDVSIYGYVGDEAQLTIPAEIGEYTVVKIDSGAFTSKKLQTVTIDASLRIEPYAFVGCSSLTRISSSKNITLRGTIDQMCKGCSPKIDIADLIVLG